MTPAVATSGTFRQTAKVGSRLLFKEDRLPFTIQAADGRFAVCTRPHGQTVMYCVIDIREKIRGTENLVQSGGAESKSQCFKMLERIRSGETRISMRNRIPLNIVAHYDK